MKRVFQFSILILALVCFFNADAYGQKKKKKGTKTDQYFDESGGFSHKLWYGSGFNFGFSGGTNIYGRQESYFAVGISPMVGYKIFDKFSAGPRASIQYTSIRSDLGGGQVSKVKPFAWSIGAFARYKIIPIIFAHVEYGYEDEPVGYSVSGNDITVIRQQRGSFYVGAGYSSSSGGPWGYEISILYDVNAPENSIQHPIDYRIGITYNF